MDILKTELKCQIINLPSEINELENNDTMNHYCIISMILSSKITWYYTSHPSG